VIITITMTMRWNNILLVDKPKGVTSYGVIRRLKKIYPGEKIGHAGTLDPLATGLLLIGIGPGTKELTALVGLPKQYEAEILLGVKTDTGDLDGAVVESQKVYKVESEKIKEVLRSMVGSMILPVPIYSATKQGGEALYKKARRGDKLIIPKREMEIFSIELISNREVRLPYSDLGSGLGKSDFPKDFQNLPKSDFGKEGGVLSVRMDVSSGSYVRSIVEEIGKRLGVPATAKELRRTRVGEYKVEDARSV